MTQTAGGVITTPPCRDRDPELWFPLSAATDTSEAEAWCAVCPIKQECLDGAIERNERHGVWGGVNMLRHGPKGSRRGWHA